MRVLIINPPYQTFTSRFGAGHQVPLGLLKIGGVLIDAGHIVDLLDAEARQLPMSKILEYVDELRPQLALVGHAGSTPAHTTCIQLLNAIKSSHPDVVTIYGGVFPTYHPKKILEEELSVDIIVRGEGEQTILDVVNCLERHSAWEQTAEMKRVRGIAFRDTEYTVVTAPRPPIDRLEEYRTGWELIKDWNLYQCFGLGRSAIVQLSRGCPHQCTYCGQHSFWVKWRHRDPVALVDEIERLHRTYGVNFITLADENPTTLRMVWNKFLEELCRRRLPVYFFATIRATDIVRDMEMLPLWKQAGLLYVLMGLETTDPDVIKQIRKGSTTRIDFQACQLLKQHKIFSILGHVVGLAEDSHVTFKNARAQLALYDGDFLNAMYVTPHTWTVFGDQMKDKAIVEPDQRKWDYRHQVLEQNHLSRTQLFLHVKFLELWYHLRPSKVYRTFKDADAFLRRQYLWTLTHTALVFVAEVVEFFTTPRRRGEQRLLSTYAEHKTKAEVALSR